MSTISSSTANALDGVPPEHKALVTKACNAYCKQRDKALEASYAHSQQVSDGITLAIEAHRLQLEVLPHRNRTSFLMERLQANFKKFGLKQTPDRETVKPLIDAAFEIDADL